MPHDLDREQVRLLRRVDGLVDLMENRFQVPGTRMRVGLDVILGLLPGVGDLVTSLMALYVVWAGYQLGVSTTTLIRMLGNLVLDGVIGSVPFLGAGLDLFWKANLRNARLIHREIAV